MEFYCYLESGICCYLTGVILLSIILLFSRDDGDRRCHSCASGYQAKGTKTCYRCGSRFIYQYFSFRCLLLFLFSMYPPIGPAMAADFWPESIPYFIVVSFFGVITLMFFLLQKKSIKITKEEIKKLDSYFVDPGPIPF